jgi:hypothetical protein
VDGHQREKPCWTDRAIVNRLAHDRFRRGGKGVFSRKQRGDPRLDARHGRGEATDFGQTGDDSLGRPREHVFPGK